MRSNRPRGSASRPSADLAGRAVAIAPSVPAIFDAPLAPHHRLIGRWVAQHDAPADLCTRHETRRRIERVFADAVTAILQPFDLVDLRVMVLVGEAELPPALALICDSIGQLDLGWIEKSNVLSTTLFETIAPMAWRAAAYQALARALPAALPIMAYDDLIEELSAYWWDGETTDAEARKALIEYHGAEADDLTEMILPSDVAARRPDWMTATPAPLKHMPAHLRAALKRLRDAAEALRTLDRPRNAWRAGREHVDEYLPGLEDRSHLPPLTIVPFDHFANELDDVCRIGMETGFDDVVGLCPLTDIETIDAWFASLRLGADLLVAAQALINLDPTKLQ